MGHSRYHRLVGLVLSCIFLSTSVLASLPASGHAEEIYHHKRMWPNLPQPWYFTPGGLAIDTQGNVYVADSGNNRIHKFSLDGQFHGKWGNPGTGDSQFNFPVGIALDGSGNVYVTDRNNHRIQKFSLDGQFLGKWGSSGTGDGQFWYPESIAVDRRRNVYVADTYGYRIQKFSSDGQFLGKWGSFGQGDGQFFFPDGIVIDDSGNLYVADGNNNRIQKFSSDGQFLGKWGSEGAGDGQFVQPAGLALDSSGNLYVADRNHRIQKFSPDGQFLGKWGSEGAGDGQLYYPGGIAIEDSGNVYVADANNRIQKFSSEGKFLGKWWNSGTGDGQFANPWGIAIDRQGNVYVADADNHRIQKFSSEGQFLGKWGSEGTGDGQFKWPLGIAVDGSGNVYVTTTRIQKFSSEGQFLGAWGSEGRGDGEFESPRSIAVDGSGNVYVVDALNYRIQKFSSEGQFLGAWGSGGTEDGQFDPWNGPSGIAVDGSGNVYVSDTNNRRIQKFSSDGQFLSKWGSYGEGDGEFIFPDGIAVDDSGNVYVTDTYTNRIQKFSSDGQFLCKWGKFGSGTDQMNGPIRLAISPNGSVYVAERLNNRIQVFKQVPQESRSKALIVAGGGPGDNLWDATQMSANFAYRALTYQGFPSQNVRYLSSNTGLDLDNNGVSDVFGKATKDNLRQSITDWAKDADNLVLYFTDHGGNETFSLSDTQEILQARDLSSWLHAIPDTRVVLVYDACQSGSFVAPLAGKGRILISSANPAEKAFFGNKGTLSFSNFFWTQVFNGSSLAEAFSFADKAIRLSLLEAQHPLIEANGDGKPNEPADLKVLQATSITSGTSTFNSPPTIKKIQVVQTPDKPSTVSFVADGVSGKKGDTISRVWTVIRPPNYSSDDSGNPLNDLPYVNLTRVEGTNRYEGSYGGFNTPGTYHVAFYAMNGMLNISVPKTTKVVIKSPLTHKAILVAGWSSNTNLRSSVKYNMKLAYKALRDQYYAKKDIKVLSSLPSLPDVPVNGTATMQHLQEAIEAWANDSTQDLLVYLVGAGQEGNFVMNQNEKLSGTDLSPWLDSFQAAQAGPGDVVVIYDASRSGSFLPLLPPAEGKRRIVISSATEAQPAFFMLGGVVSFSQFFWTQVIKGANVRDAFLEAYSAVNGASGMLKQQPQLDDNGNGIGNEASDSLVARLLKIGMGIASAGNAPVICGGCVGLSGNTGTSATIWAKNITTTAKIDKVWATIIPPNFQPGSADNAVTNLPALNLKNVGKGKYQATYKGFSTPGDYDIAVYAIDTGGNVSNPQHITVSR